MAVQLIINVAIALVWAFLQQSFDGVTLATGYVIGAAIIYVVHRMLDIPFYLRRMFAACELFVVFVWEVIVANVKVAYQVLHPGLPVRPGFIAYPLDVKTDAEITLLALLITMTPGTLSVDVTDDRSHLIVHVLDLDDPDHVKASIKDAFERRIQKVVA